MRSLLPAVAVGFFLGIRHATDPDHLLAMSTLVSRSKRFGGSWLLGVFWGLGHTFTIVLVGILILGFKLAIPPRIGAGMEFSVGIMLCLLGILNMAGYGLGRLGIEEHSHEHGPDHHAAGREGAQGTHSHAHAHSRPLESLLRSAGRFQIGRAFGVGLIHGLAGSSAIALLVLTAIPSFAMGMAYLLVFGLGTLVGMIGFSTLLEGAIFWTARRLDFQKQAASCAGLMSFIFGLYIMYQIGFVGWTAH